MGAGTPHSVFANPLIDLTHSGAGYRDDSECATAEQSCVGSQSSTVGYELWDLCNDHLLFHQSHNAGPIFCSLSRRDNAQGGPHEYLDS
jgi:hypothetical protein